MTTTDKLIKSALIQCGAIDVAEGLDNPDANTGVNTLNRMVRNLFGNGIGAPLMSCATTSDTTAFSGQMLSVDSTDGAITITAPPNPQRGARFGVSDARLRFTTHAATVDPGANLIEGARAVIPLVTNGESRTWFYRDDTSNWVRETNVALTDDFILAPFLDESVISCLAGRLAIQYAANLSDPAVQVMLKLAAQGHDAIVRHYGRRGKNHTNPYIGAMNDTALQRGGAV